MATANSTRKLPKLSEEDISRFWSSVDKSGGPDACWLWTRAISSRGYGYFHTQERTIAAHRLSWLLLSGEDPGNMLVCHKCDNPKCVRRDHLFLGTHTENMRDMYEKGRGPTGEKSGARKHPEKFSGGETHWSKKYPEKFKKLVSADGITRAKGENAGAAKLTEEKVREMRRMRELGFKTKEIASKFDISTPAAHQAINRKTWRHVL